MSAKKTSPRTAARTAPKKRSARTPAEVPAPLPKRAAKSAAALMKASPKLAGKTPVKSAPKPVGKLDAKDKPKAKSAAVVVRQLKQGSVASRPEPVDVDLRETPPPKTSVRKKRGGRPTFDELKAMQTDEVWALYRKARKAGGDEPWCETLRNALMELHYPLVRHIAERLLQTLPKSIELDDLVSAGVFGLMDAIRGFDPDRGIKFKTYCTTRIRGSILDQLRSQDWVPRLVRLKAARIDKALAKLRGEYGREPTHAELALYLRMNNEELLGEIDEARPRQMTSINERWNEHDDDSSMEKVDMVEDQTALDPSQELNKRDMLSYLTRSLTHKEQFIIEQYYKIGHTMREIGEMLALTESRVCQIHSNVMSRLKSLLGPKSTGLGA